MPLGLTHNHLLQGESPLVMSPTTTIQTAICTDEFIHEGRRHTPFFHISTHMDFKTLLGNKKYTPRKISFSFIPPLFFVSITKSLMLSDKRPMIQKDKMKKEK